MEKEDNNLKQTSLIKQVLTSEVKFIISIVVFVFGIASPYFGMKQDIALIQQSISNINSNHEVHIQDIVQDLKDLHTADSDQRAEILQLQKQLVALLAKNK